MEATARGIPRSHSELWPYAQRGSGDAARNAQWSEAGMGLTPWRSFHYALWLADLYMHRVILHYFCEVGTKKSCALGLCKGYSEKK